MVGALQAKGQGSLPDVALTLGLVNKGPYPVSSSWAAVVECRPSHEGGVHAHHAGNHEWADAPLLYL